MVSPFEPELPVGRIALGASLGVSKSCTYGRARKADIPCSNSMREWFVDIATHGRQFLPGDPVNFLIAAEDKLVDLLVYAIIAAIVGILAIIVFVSDDD